MKVTGDWLTADSTQAVFAALRADGNSAFAVGGCVRNALMNVPVTDVDIATDATPETVQALAQAAGLKSVPTGIDHGTITVVSGGTGYEVTTFRADTETNGRHAIVRFSTDMAEDAARRDFTMNALYADAGGQVVDPLGGLPDLEARRVRFIGNAHDRIVEDYLRILRFFRFAAWYGDPDLGFDADALAAIADTLDGLNGLSRERIGGEMIKLLSASDPAPAVGSMEQTGVLHVILPGSATRGLAPLIHLEHSADLAPDAIRRLAALGVFDGDGLRLSKKQQRRLEQYQSLISTSEPPAELGYRHGAEVARDVLLLRAALLEIPLDADALRNVEMGSRQKCPVKPGDLMPAYSGAELGAKLREIEDRWVASGFALSKSDLLG
ncbi:CCA tRNA nucleotidyltransferase [Marivita sp. XM-24bin2]|jgi:poly(A) polymerase|uniref:CCA tRNA nucleotidyltransferase n=1 Tax=unclassified Marivita TaxID=2632480 RepID=UPI000D7AF174|nr:CCA tRNA nucleotidyltransferase [Marivita sp. XM-24bin2]MCR9110193.1 CCA tRNA nucleotidyltransferase [Paracoccaceae bacterium]PWL34501.1 MAG: CCA tRNA nucleotidyltransferase [Marivita sp. XM-24bin2]